MDGITAHANASCISEWIPFSLMAEQVSGAKLNSWRDIGQYFPSDEGDPPTSLERTWVVMRRAQVLSEIEINELSSACRQKYQLF